MFSKVFVIGCFLASALGAPSLDDTRIVGGFNAQPGQFPYQVSLRYNNQHFCGGSIISTKTVLTAAHCYQPPSSLLTAVVGATYLLQGGVAHSIANFYKHEKFNPDSLENDIAVVILTTPITFNQYAQPIPLPISNVDNNVQAIASGWGLTSYPSNVPPNTLQYFYTNTISFDQCRQMHTGGLVYSQICVFKQIGQGVCKGDSGGPLVSGGRLQGVASAAYLCAIGYPDFYTRVYSFLPWINKNAK